MSLHHYIVVRRDLPTGVVFAQIAHAAGESFYAFRGSSGSERLLDKQEDGSSPLPRGANPAETIAVVLGARNEARLAKLRRTLEAHAVPHVAIVETDPPNVGGLMALGLVPGWKADLSPYLKDFQVFRGAEDGE